MSEVRKKQKQILPNKGKALCMGPRAGSHLAPALWRVAAERRIRVRCCLLTPAVVVIHGMTRVEFVKFLRTDFNGPITRPRPALETPSGLAYKRGLSSRSCSPLLWAKKITQGKGRSCQPQQHLRGLKA